MAVSKDVREYIREKLKEGHTPEVLKKRLLIYGHDPSMVDDIHAENHKPLTQHFFKKLSVILICVTLIVIMMFVNWQSESSFPATVSKESSFAQFSYQAPADIERNKSSAIVLSMANLSEASKIQICHNNGQWVCKDCVSNNCTVNLDKYYVPEVEYYFYSEDIYGNKMRYPDATNLKIIVTDFKKSMCTENWNCSEWSICINNNQARVCVDKNACGTFVSKPSGNRSCIICQEKWMCDSWLKCTNNTQKRACIDENACGTNTLKPNEIQKCSNSVNNTICTENWNCTSWSACSSNIQARTCTDKNVCGTQTSKPPTSQACSTCVENWNCTSWSACSNNQQTRKCTDKYTCGTYLSKPAESQSCISDTDGDGDPDTTDCAPTNAVMHHGATEICDNGIDENCDETDSECPLPYTMNVLDLSYIPIVNGKVDISQTGDWQNEDINALISNIDSLRNGVVSTLDFGSIYHAYKDQYAVRSLDYLIFEKKIFYTPVPPSSTYKGMDNAPSADHMKILNDLNICDYVENKGVNEVWIWMYHTKKVAPIESNMAGPYGDISNSYRENDLPVCKKTYVVYDYNYGRSYSMAVEDHTHQIEAVLRYVDYNLFWDLFVGPNGGGKCGWTHYPPNGRYDYDWNNENTVSSDCEDWRPDGTGQKKITDCKTWSTNPSVCDPDEGLSFKKWWMQNIPGKNSNLYYNGKKLKNWWVYIGNFDTAMISKSLTY